MNSQNRTRVFSSLLLATLAVTVFAEIEKPYEVGPWGNFAKGAVSFTFDDNTPNQIDVAQPIFDEFDFNMTMFIVINWLDGNLEKYVPAAKSGHEIASHTMSHSSNSSELKSSQDKIRSEIPGEMGVTIAYPNCNPIGDNEVKKYYIAGRVCGGQINNASPANLMQITSTICGSGGLNSTQQLKGLADQAATQGGWGVYLFHGVDKEPQGSSDYSPASSSAIKGCLEYLDKNRNKVWVETFGNVARYIKERNAVSVKVKESSDKKIVVTVTDNLPDSLFNYPLSIRRPIPDGWSTAYMSQDDEEIEDSIVTESSNKYVVFKAVPDGGDVVISEIPPTEIGTVRPAFKENAVSPVRLQRNCLNINAKHFGNAACRVTLSDINGKVLISKSFAGNRTGIVFPVGQFVASAFIASVTGSRGSWSGLFVAPR